MTDDSFSKLHVALLSYDEREIRVRKNYLEEQNPAICCVCFHSGESCCRELRQQRSVDIVVLSSQLEDMDGYEFLKRLNSLHNRPLLLLQGDDWYSDATASFLRPDGRQYLPERSSLLGSGCWICAAPRTSASSGCCRSASSFMRSGASSSRM